MPSISGQGKTQSSLSVRVEGLDRAANQIRIIIYLSGNSSGSTFLQSSTDQGYGTNRYSGTYTFTGLTAGRTYYLFAELFPIVGNFERVPVGTSNVAYTTDSPPQPVYPGTPSVYFNYTDGRTLWWVITPGANTTGINIDRSWSNVTSTGAYGSSFNWNYTASSDGTYSIRVQGTNSDGSSSYTGYSSGTVLTLPAPLTLSVSLLGRNSFQVNFGGGARSTSFSVEVYEGTSTAGTAVFTRYGITTGSLSSLPITGLKPGTNYFIRGYATNSWGQSSSTTLQTKTTNPLPPKLAWRVRVPSGNFDLTAREWNDLLAKINEWRVFRQIGTKTFTAVSTGGTLSASIFNNVVDEINAVSPSYSPPAKVVVNENVTAAKINRLSDSIDSIS